MTLRSRTGETFNEATGFVTGGSDVNTSVVGILFPRKTKKRSDGSATTRLWTALISAVDAEGVALAVPPTEDHKLVVGDEILEITEVMPLSPANIDVLYELTVAR